MPVNNCGKLGSRFSRTLLAVSTVVSLALAVASLSTAHASTSRHYYSTNIYLNGQEISTPSHLADVDPFSGSSEATSYVPFWYVNQALSKLEITANWDGEVLNLQIPSSMSVNMPSSVTPVPLNNGSMEIQVNGKAVTYAPRIIYYDSGTSIQTSFMPVYYLQKTLGALGIQTGWDGTAWTMTYHSSQQSINKLQVAKDFAGTLGIYPSLNSGGTDTYDDVPASDYPLVQLLVQKGYFTPDSSTHFGSNDPIVANTVDHAYQLYVGIPDSHMQWQAGGTLANWSNDIGLNLGVGTSGNLGSADEQQLETNLTALKNGYRKNSNGTYTLVFQPSDAYAAFFPSNGADMLPSGWTASTLASALQSTIHEIDSTSLTVNGSTLIFKTVGLSANDTNFIGIRSLKPLTDPTYYSFDGSSWTQAKDAIYGYDSANLEDGGRTAAPSAVWVKANDGATMSTAQGFSNGGGVSLANVKVADNGGQLSITSAIRNQAQ